MSQIIDFITVFLGAPLQLVIILFVFALFLYWYIKVRPKEQKAQNTLITDLINQNKVNRDEVEKERKNFFKVMEDYRAQQEKISALYDKALEHSTRAIENNTEVIKNQNIHTQLTNQALQSLNHTMERAEERLGRIEKVQSDVALEVHEIDVLVDR